MGSLNSSGFSGWWGGGDDADNADWHPVIDQSIHAPTDGVFAGVHMANGDGTVPLLSLGYMCVKGWKDVSACVPRSASSMNLAGGGVIPVLLLWCVSVCVCGVCVCACVRVRACALCVAQPSRNPASIPVTTREYLQSPGAPTLLGRLPADVLGAVASAGAWFGVRMSCVRVAAPLR
jgi:hypothetical protein